MNGIRMANDLRAGNGELRGLAGSGEPGLYTVLGGTAVEQDGEQMRMLGGAGQVSATSRLAQVHRDVRLAAVASGSSPGGATAPSSGSQTEQGRPRTHAK